MANMSNYIDADKLKKLIDKKWKELADKNAKAGGGIWDIEISTYLSVLGLIESLQQEQPEVDLENEIQVYSNYLEENGLTASLEAVALHFWNKGYNARKEE